MPGVVTAIALDRTVGWWHSEYLSDHRLTGHQPAVFIGKSPEDVLARDDLLASRLRFSAARCRWDIRLPLPCSELLHLRIEHLDADAELLARRERGERVRRRRAPFDRIAASIGSTRGTPASRPFSPCTPML